MQGTRKINEQWTNDDEVTVNLVLAEGTEKDLKFYKIYGAGLADGDADWVEVTTLSATQALQKFTDIASDSLISICFLPFIL